MSYNLLPSPLPGEIWKDLESLECFRMFLSELNCLIFHCQRKFNVQ